MSKATLLIVDDERFYTNLLEGILHLEYNVIIATDGAEALEILKKQSIDLILLDILMPGIDGYEVCKQIKTSELFGNIPVIFLTVKNEAEDEIKGFALGAVDFIIKPISPPVVKARVATQIALSQANKKLQQHAHNLEQLVNQRTEELTQEISEKQKVYDQLHYLANYDQLTRLPNRNLFNERLEQTYELAKRNNNSFSLLFIDLDDFKYVNDSLGHHIGDLLLEQVGLRLSKCLRGVDTVARLGGDEFIVTLTKIQNKQDSIVVAEKILLELARPFEINIQTIQIGSSIGITTYPDDDKDLDSMLRNADLAMYKAKHSGKNVYQFFTPDMRTTQFNQQLELENDLQNALIYNELYLNYQVIIDLKSRKITGVECLLRWLHPKQGQVKPDKIIAIAEQSNLIIKLGNWILETAYEQLASWLKLGYTDLQYIAINMSARQFDRNNVSVTLIKDLIQRYQLPRNSIHLEISENLLFENTRFIANTLAELKSLGILLTVDDFGTGYSSLSYLRRFPISLIKIDRTIISGLAKNSDDSTTAKAIIKMGESLNLKVIAEGVETKEQLAFLQDHGCHFAQGYFFSKPVSGSEIEKMLKVDFRLKTKE
jgi:diguanylate cyclase (GGDEF)-like protein